MSTITATETTEVQRRGVEAESPNTLTDKVREGYEFRKGFGYLGDNELGNFSSELGHIYLLRDYIHVLIKRIESISKDISVIDLSKDDIKRARKYNRELCDEVAVEAGKLNKALNSLNVQDTLELLGTYGNRFVHYQKDTKFRDGKRKDLPESYETDFEDNMKVPVSVISRRRGDLEERGEWVTIVNYYCSDPAGLD